MPGVMRDRPRCATVAPSRQSFPHERSRRMQLGMIGLGRMGANMVRRLMRDGHDCVVYNRSPQPVEQLVGEGATGSGSLAELVQKLETPRFVWLMVPAGVVDRTLAD